MSILHESAAECVCTSSPRVVRTVACCSLTLPASSCEVSLNLLLLFNLYFQFKDNAEVRESIVFCSLMSVFRFSSFLDELAPHTHPYRPRLHDYSSHFQSCISRFTLRTASASTLSIRSTPRAMPPLALIPPDSAPMISSLVTESLLSAASRLPRSPLLCNSEKLKYSALMMASDG